MHGLNCEKMKLSFAISTAMYLNLHLFEVLYTKISTAGLGSTFSACLTSALP